jgi:hypothetical protein
MGPLHLVGLGRELRVCRSQTWTSCASAYKRVSGRDMRPVLPVSSHGKMAVIGGRLDRMSFSSVDTLSLTRYYNEAVGSFRRSLCDEENG